MKRERTPLPTGEKKEGLHSGTDRYNIQKKGNGEENKLENSFDEVISLDIRESSRKLKISKSPGCGVRSGKISLDTSTVQTPKTREIPRNPLKAIDNSTSSIRTEKTLNFTSTKQSTVSQKSNSKISHNENKSPSTPNKTQFKKTLSTNDKQCMTELTSDILDLKMLEFSSFSSMFKVVSNKN